MKKLLAITLFATCTTAMAADIYALGTSNTNCKMGNGAYTRKLNELLGSNNRVINGGENADRPVWMVRRIKTAVENNPNIKVVILEPGPNERNKKYNLEPTVEIIEFLKEKGIKVIYVSHGAVQSVEEAEEFAEQQRVYYYGNWSKGVPVDRDHRAYDYPPGTAGHMTAQGCELWAEQMATTVSKVIKENNIK